MDEERIRAAGIGEDYVNTRLLIAVVSLSVTAGLLSGCAGDESSSDDRVFLELVEESIDDARSGGADAAQVAALEFAKNEGSLTLETARDATRATVHCFIESGLQAEFFEETGADGLTVPSYSVWRVGELSDGDELAIEVCDTAHSFWINKVYQLQPSSSQLKAEFIDENSEELRACLEGAGYPTDPDATGIELAQQAGEVAVHTSGEVDCLSKIGAM